MEDPQKFKIKSFKTLEDFVIEIEFYEGKIQVIDFSKINNPFWENLKDLRYFNQVHLNDIYNLEWPNNLDFKPEHLYYWEKFGGHYTPDE